MAQIKVTSAQWQLAFTTSVDYDEVGDQVTIDVPPGFVLLDGVFVVDVAFNGTTPTFTLVDNKASPTTLITGGALTAGAKPLLAAAKGTYYPAGGKITLAMVVASGTPTAGSGQLVLSGVVMNRQNEKFGTVNAT